MRIRTRRRAPAEATGATGVRRASTEDDRWQCKKGRDRVAGSVNEATPSLLEQMPALDGMRGSAAGVLLDRRASGRLASMLVVACGVIGIAQPVAAHVPGQDTALALAVGVVATVGGALLWVLPWQGVSHRAQLAMLVPPAAALIGLDLAAASEAAVALWALVAANVWIGLAQPRWTAVKVMPVNAAACVVPLIVGNELPWRAVGVLLALPLTVAMGEIIAWVSSSVIEMRSSLETTALLDPLTGLPNRRAFTGAAAMAVERARRQGTKIMIAIVDLDGFKDVNDSYGHMVGDEVLAEVAKRLAGAVRAGDLVARIGGDEFAVVAEDIYSVGEEPGSVLDRIRSCCVEPLSAGADQVRIGLSIGGAVATPSAEASVEVGDLVARMLSEADKKMYEAKRSYEARRSYEALSAHVTKSDLRSEEEPPPP